MNEILLCHCGIVQVFVIDCVMLVSLTPNIFCGNMFVCAIVGAVQAVLAPLRYLMPSSDHIETDRVDWRAV